MEKAIVNHHEKKTKPHAVLIPFPQQGHISPMFNLAKLLHAKGFHITFLNTEFCHRKMVGNNFHRRLPRDFKFGAIPSTDFEIVVSGNDAKLVSDITTRFLTPVTAVVKELIDKSSASHHQEDDDGDVVPPITCLVSDPLMTFSVDVAKKFDIPLLYLFVFSSATLVTIPHTPKLLQDGLLPIKDEKGYLDTTVEGIPGINGTIRLKDLPKFFRLQELTSSGPSLFFTNMFEKSREKNSSIGVIVNTSEELEPEAVGQLSSIFPEVFPIGPFHQLVNEISSEFDSLIQLNSAQEEDLSCLAWLDSKPPNSVLLVSFGTTGFLTPKQLEEFAWGLANCQESFLWVIRSDLITGDDKSSNSYTTPWSPEFESAIKDRGLIVSWCPQETVLNHPAIGGYLTHCGWNSLLESVTAGVPMLCWPSFVDQTTNSWVSCHQWGNGMEIGTDVRREEIVRLVRELISGKKGKEMKKKSMELKKKTVEACRGPNGSSFRNLQKLVNKITSGASRGIRSPYNDSNLYNNTIKNKRLAKTSISST